MAFRTNKTPVLQEKTASGSVATFNTALAMPLASCNVAVNAWQEGSGTPSPDNVRTINGYSAINIGAVGKNFLESNQDLIKAANGGANTWTDNKKTIGNIEVSLLDDGGINLNGTASSNTVIMLHTRFAVLDYPSTMKMYIGTQSSINGLSFRISSADLPGSQLICTNPSIPVTIPDIKMNNADVFIFINGTTQLTNVKVYPMILLSTETDINYVPYNGTYTTITIGSTVYGGEYDARTGVLTVTHGYIASYNGEVINEPWISSMDKYVEGGTPTSGAQVVYPLSTPTTIQLPPCPIDTLVGVNNIWADTGDIDLTYKDLDIAKRGNFREVFKLPS